MWFWVHISSLEDKTRRHSPDTRGGTHQTEGDVHAGQIIRHGKIIETSVTPVDAFRPLKPYLCPVRR